MQYRNYDETILAYTQIVNNGILLVPGAGYVASIGNTDAIYTFSGSQPNTGAITLSPTRSGTSSEKRGFNLIGNPYPSYLDWNAVEKTYVRQTIWVRTFSSWKAMVFDTYDGTIGTSNGAKGELNRFVPPMQAFWVKVNMDGDVASLTLNNAMRSHEGATHSRSNCANKRDSLQQLRQFRFTEDVE